MEGKLNNFIWVFHGAGGRFTAGVFTSKEKAEEWILKYLLTGILTSYPLDIGIYEWAINNNLFKPKNDDQMKAEFIQKFSSASQEHYHYENGKLDSV